MAETDIPKNDGAKTDIAKRASFDTIRYAQVWEDADVLVAALRPKPSDTIVSIASAGDNALALLGEGPARVIAVDLNPAQLACLRLRMQAYRMDAHADFLELMGSRVSGRRAYLLDQVTQKLSPEDQKFWAARKDQAVRYGVAGIGKFESYFRTFREWVLPFVHNRETIDELLRFREPKDRIAFYENYWNIWMWRQMLKVFFSKQVMGKLGRDPAFFDHVRGNPSDHVAKLTKKALVEQDPSDNPYLHWILRGTHGEALPRAWTLEKFETIRDRLDRLELRLATVEELAKEGIKADGFNLSDIFEYMSPEAHKDAYGKVLETAAPGARIAYWNMMAPRRVPHAFAERVQTNTALEAKLKPLDKAFFYSDFVIEEVK